jgi:hypothetical protein
MKPREQQDIYNAITATAEEISTGLKKMIEAVKGSMEALIESQHTKNEQLAELSALNDFLNPELSQHLDGATKRRVESLQNTLRELSEADNEIQKTQATMRTIQEKGGSIDPKLTSSSDLILKKVLKLDEKLKLIAKEKIKHGMLSENVNLAGLADPKIVSQTLENNLFSPLYEKANKLKQSAKLIHKEIQEEASKQQYTSPKPGKSSSS